MKTTIYVEIPEWLENVGRYARKASQATMKLEPGVSGVPGEWDDLADETKQHWIKEGLWNDAVERANREAAAL